MIDSTETLSQKFVRKWFWLYVFSFLAWPIWYFIKIILSHDLSVEEIGILYWVVSLVSLLTVYHDLWLTESLNFFLPKFIVENDYKRFKSVLAYAMLAQIPTSLIIGWLLYFWSDFLAINYFHTSKAAEVLRIFCLFFIWMNLYSIISTVYWASQNTKYQKWIELIRMLAILAITLVFFLTWNWTLNHYSWNWIFGLFIGVIVTYSFFYVKYYKPYLQKVKVTYDKELIKKVFSYAIWVLLAANVWMVLSQIDMQLIIYLLGAESAWYYTNYLSIIWIPFLVIAPIIWFLFPVVSELHGKWDEEKIKTIKSMFYKYFWVIWVVVSAFMFVFARELSVVFFWEKFSFSGDILMFSVFFLVFNFLLQINFQILAWTWRIRERVKILWVWLAFNIPLNLILINFFESMQQWKWVLGSSLAVWLSWIPMFYLSNRATRKYSTKFDLGFFLKNTLIASFLCLILSVFWKPLFIWAGRLESLFLILILWFLYIMPLAILNMREWKLFLDQILKIKKSK
ncbi:MAG: polysaccharide biosynthesis protein [uncultured bacterium (gcode 4)]|uniref:Polysaccharide biosynthesis protein n=1 Tax=uncultured bacterium (gcode 4) TaxID=1234023 RepID=K2GH85_9BACT|nr:MAG: polysaccharide biosynthesis protein [uncultured bacterium (gcode 4)]